MTVTYKHTHKCSTVSCHNSYLRIEGRKKKITPADEV